MTNQHDQWTQTFASIGIDIARMSSTSSASTRRARSCCARSSSAWRWRRSSPSCRRAFVELEACLSAHFVSHTLRRLGHSPRIIPAIYVKPFAKGQKNDYNDAEAIAEAALRPNLRVVQEKTQDQLDLQALHRTRPSRLASHGDDQSDPRLPHRTWHRRAYRRSRVAELALRHPGEGAPASCRRA